MRKHLILLTAAALAVGACAKSPSSIAPTAVSSSEYDGWSCQKLTTEHSVVNANLVDASDRQNDAQTADAIGVFLVLIPPSALMGDAEAEVAQYKGEKIAVERAMTNRGCTA